MQKKPDIGALLNPKTVAVIGAAPAGQGIRGRILEVLQSHAYKGKIFPVSRNLAEVQGLVAYPNIGACPEPVDLAIFVIPAKFVAKKAARITASLQRCGRPLTDGNSGFLAAAISAQSGVHFQNNARAHYFGPSHRFTHSASRPRQSSTRRR